MLKGKNINLKSIEQKDLEKFRKWINSELIRPYTRHYKPITFLDQINWFESLSNSNNIMFSIIYENTLIGSCGLKNIDWKNGNAEVSIFIGYKNAHKQGYASESLQLLLKYGFNELRLHKIYANIFDYNKNSIKFFEKNNFKLEGNIRESKYWNGKFHNEKIFGILKGEYNEVL